MLQFAKLRLGTNNTTIKINLRFKMTTSDYHSVQISILYS